MSFSKIKVFICGGGTGGHFFSGVAIGEEFLDRYPEAEIIFIGTKLGIEGRTILEDKRMRKAFIPVRGLKGKGPQAKLMGILFLIGGFLKSLFLLIKERPQMVIGVGGYASFPTVFVSVFFRWLFRWKIIVIDQNSSPGLSNQILRRLPLQAYCAFPAKGFQLVNLPVRRKFKQLAEEVEAFQWPPQKILIVGGSQGARGLNQRWRQILPHLKESQIKFRIVHQTGAADEASMREIYQDLQFEAEVFAFSDRLYDYFSKADLIICRSGAMTVFEILHFKKPCVFIPFPAATDDHQMKNALSVQSADWVIKESDLSWERMQKILGASEPRIPNRKSDDVVSWDEILKMA